MFQIHGVESNLLVLGHSIQSDGGERAEWLQIRPMLWGIFWRNCSNRSVRDLGLQSKLTLLLRCVLAAFSYKLPRWPYQKTIAVDMDACQAKMIATILRVPRRADQSLHDWWCARHCLAREVASRIGLWSLARAKRTVSFKQHISRSEGYCPLLHQLVEHRGSDWLATRRSSWVPAAGSGDSRLSLRAGRTGIRIEGGRPQPTWDEGPRLASAVIASRDSNTRGTAKLSISTRIAEAAAYIREVLYQDSQRCEG